MKIKRVFWLVFILFIIWTFAFSQVTPCIPESRRVNWQNAGLYEEPNNTADNVININSYSGTDYNKIVAAINDANLLPGMTIIYFPAGTYTIGNAINISNVKDSGIIFQGVGTGVDGTLIKFDGVNKDSHCFNIFGQYTGNHKSIDANINKGNQWLYTNDGTSGIIVGDWIHFCEPGFDDNDPENEDSWNGQISKVVEINTKNIKMKDEASKSYEFSNNMWIQEIDPAYNIGFENFKVERTNTAKGYGATFNFEITVNCWIRGVESCKCTGYHVSIGKSSHIEVSGSYLHHATNYSSNEGTGYGVVLGHSSTNCLVENNIFMKTRHAMLVGTGANCNVFTLNYSREPEWDWDAWDKWWWPIDIDPPEICLHGRYPYANLFEGNSIGLIGADPSHGDNGPYNTFFRNKTYLDNNMVIFNANYSNVIGNDIGSPEAGKCVRYNPTWYENLGYSWGEGYDVKESLYPLDVYMYNGSNPINHAYWSVYRQDGIVGADLYSISFLQDISYYYTSRPEFLNGSNYSWPAIGPHTYPEAFGYDFVIGEIPAENRWGQSIKTYLKNPTTRPFTTSGALSYDQTWFGIVALTGHVTVPTGVTLTINSGATVNYNGYSLTSTGGTISIQSGGVITLNPATYVDITGSGNTYEVNGINVGTTFNGIGQSIEANPPSGYGVAGWSDGVGGNPRKINGNITVNARLKALHKSNDATAFSNNSQRKFVRTQDGWLHQVYVSAGRVWLEHSANDGANWFLGNNGLPLDDGEGKCPSIDWGHYYYYSSSQGTYVHEHIIVAAYQQKFGNYYKIRYAVFKKVNNVYVNYTPSGSYSTLYTESSDQYSVDANPNIAISGCLSGIYDFIISFERKSGSTAGINWFYGKMGYSGVYPTYENYVGPVWVTGTNTSSINASVNLNKGIVNPGESFDIVYQQGTQYIKDVILSCTYNGVGNWTTYQSEPFTISQSTDRKSYKLSLVQKINCHISVSWIRDRTGDGGSSYYINAVNWDSENGSVYRTYGAWDVRPIKKARLFENIS